MDIKNFINLITKNNIPMDATMKSDSEYEFGPTHMDGVYYNKKKNEIVFRQVVSPYDDYADNLDFRLLK